jgi:hypothetical protein
MALLAPMAAASVLQDATSPPFGWLLAMDLGSALLGAGLAFAIDPRAGFVKSVNWPHDWSIAVAAIGATVALVDALALHQRGGALAACIVFGGGAAVLRTLSRRRNLLTDSGGT